MTKKYALKINFPRYFMLDFYATIVLIIVVCKLVYIYIYVFLYHFFACLQLVLRIFNCSKKLGFHTKPLEKARFLSSQWFTLWFSFKFKNSAKRSTNSRRSVRYVNKWFCSITIIKCNGITGRYNKTNATYWVGWTNDTLNTMANASVMTHDSTAFRAYEHDWSF